MHDLTGHVALKYKINLGAFQSAEIEVRVTGIGQELSEQAIRDMVHRQCGHATVELIRCVSGCAEKVRESTAFVMPRSDDD